MDNLQQQVNKLEQEVETLKKLFYKDNYSDLEVFTKKVQFKSDVNLGSSVGISKDKVGFYTKASAPIAQQTTFTSPTGGATVDAEARTAISAIKIILTNVGLTS